MKYLQLRVSTDGSPSPFFHPTLRFTDHSKLRSLNLIDVSTASILRSVGNVLFFAEQLSELTIWIDEDVILSLNLVFAGWPKPKMLNLKTLDLRRFSKLGLSPQSIWQQISVVYLTDLTLEIGSSLQTDDYENFWEEAVTWGVQLTRLRTNLISEGLTNFICSFSGLEVLLLKSCFLPWPVELISSFLSTVAHEHSNSLRVLAIHAQGVNKREYLLDQKHLISLSLSCTKLQELGFGILEHNLVSQFFLFKFSLLTVYTS